jgi:hypothetical protein
MSKGKFPIDDLKLISVHGAKGSMICSLLNLLEEEFAYQSVPKRTLVYFGKSAKSTTA